VKGDSPRPKEWLEDMAGGVVAMAGGRELAAHAKQALEATKHRIEGMGGREKHDEAHQGENGDGGGSETTVHAEGRSADLGAAVEASSCPGGREIGTGR